MSLRTIAYQLKPTTASVGYALFLAVNATGVWGGVFPFLPLEFQTPDILLWFFLAQALVFSASYFASAAGVYFSPSGTRRFLVSLASAPYFCGWCCLIAAIYLDAWALPLVVCGGALLGLGSAGFYMLWQRLFASQDPEQGNRDLMVGTALAAIVYFALYLIPQAVTTFLIPLVFLPLFGLSIVLKGRTIDRDQPMFEDVPRDHPRVYRRVVSDYWRSALCVGAVAICTGIMRSLAIGEASSGTYVNALSMAGSLIAAIVVLVLWQRKGVRLSIVRTYRILFPFIITSFVVLPFAPDGYSRWLAAALYALYSAAIMLMMIQCAQVSRDRGINPVFIYGLFAGLVYAMHDLGFVAGTFAERVQAFGITPLGATALAAVYLLGIMSFVGPGGFRSAVGRKSDESIELVPPPQKRTLRVVRVVERPTNASAVATASDRPANVTTTLNDENAFTATSDRVEQAAPPPPAAHEATAIPVRDLISEQTQRVKECFLLSSREAEVMELIARGYSVARIAEELVVSENTIRTHSKRIYAKLNVHKKQELIELVTTFDPNAFGQAER